MKAETEVYDLCARYEHSLFVPIGRTSKQRTGDTFFKVKDKG
jgi:hypothetical protein